MRNGATWQVSTVTAFEAAGLSRTEALHEMALLYAKHMHLNEPAHTWPIGG
jgi:hypothetical protein